MDAIRSRRAEHIFWLIEHVPEHACLGEPECQVLAGMDQFYDRFKQLWSTQVSKHPLSAIVFGNAGMAVLVEDGYKAEKWLLEAGRLAPEDPEWPHMLSVVYELRAKYTIDKIDKKRWKKMSAESMAWCMELRRKREQKA